MKRKIEKFTLLHASILNESVSNFLHTEKFQSNNYNEMHHIYAQYYTSDLFFPSGKITPLTSPDKKKIKFKMDR